MSEKRELKDVENAPEKNGAELKNDTLVFFTDGKKWFYHLLGMDTAGIHVLDVNKDKIYFIPHTSIKMILLPK